MHTRVHYEVELDQLRELLLKMGGQVDTMVGKAMDALVQQDVVLAEEIMRLDDEVDAMDVRIEGECMRLIALQQPMARDLRLIGTALKVITDLERIGDHAVDIAKVARKLAYDSLYKPLVDLPRLASMVRQMLHDALTAFVNHDLELVRQVVLADDLVDELYHQLRDELHDAMRRDSRFVVQASYLLFVAHYLERMADHIVNIVERVHYVETSSLVQLAKGHKIASGEQAA
jgi:phosphate transport system protein